MFVTALFTIAKMWKQPKCLLIDDWIKIDVVNIYTMELYLVIKKRMKLYHLQQHG